VIQDQLLLLDGLRAGDEAAFAALVRSYGAAMLRVAQLYVRSRAVAEEVVQEAWIGVLKGAARFEGRSSLKTWIFRILTNTAKTRAAREGRTIPFSELDRGEPAVDPDRFRGPEDRYPGHWAARPTSLPEERLLEAETLALVQREIDKLPPPRRRSSSRCVMSKGSTPTKCVTPWRSARPINVCSFTGPDPSCATRSRTT